MGDFKEVEDNFKEITQKTYEKQQQHDLSKGQLLADTFDALYALKNTDQGKISMPSGTLCWMRKVSRNFNC